MIGRIPAPPLVGYRYPKTTEPIITTQSKDHRHNGMVETVVAEQDTSKEKIAEKTKEIPKINKYTYEADKDDRPLDELAAEGLVNLEDEIEKRRKPVPVKAFTDLFKYIFFLGDCLLFPPRTSKL